MQSLSGFARKYAIMEELDSGFGAGSTPEAFVRLDSWEGRIQASLHIKGLKQGPYAYKLYLIFAKHDQLIPLLAGSMSTSYSGMQNGLEIDAESLKTQGLKPDAVRYAAITAESQDKKWVPLFSSFEKNYKWDESIRQLLLKKPHEDKPKYEEIKPQTVFVDNVKPEMKTSQSPHSIERPREEVRQSHVAPIQITPNAQSAGILNQAAAPNLQPNEPAPQKEERMLRTEPDYSLVQQNPQMAMSQENPFNRCDINKLEGFLKDNFEESMPFKRASRGYSWYRVSDLAKLSNIMYMSGVNVPVFANPKILVGLFKYKHILAGLYHGDNGAHYYVIGVPAKNESDNRPFETACRWVPVSDGTVRDMGGYWLVYVSLKSGEIVV